MEAIEQPKNMKLVSEQFLDSNRVVSCKSLHNIDQYSTYDKWENIETKKKKVKIEKRTVTVDKMKMKIEKKKVDRRRYTYRLIDIGVKYCSYFEQDYNRVMYEMEVEQKMIDKEKKMIELYEKTYKKTDVGFCLLLNTSLSKDVIEIIREYVYEHCEECNYITEDFTKVHCMIEDTVDFTKVHRMSKVFCENCLRLFLCTCGRKLGYNGRCCHCDYMFITRRSQSSGFRQ